MRRPLAAALAIVLCLAAAAQATASPGRYVTVAKGETDGTSWSYEVHGGDGKRCYAARFERADFSGVSKSMAVTCRRASAPVGDWGHLLGIGLNEEGGAFDLQQTSARVHYLELLLTDPSGGEAFEPEWRSVRTRALTAGQRAKAKLGPGFRFAAVADPRPFCVTAVRTFDRERVLLRERRVPCEY